MKSLKQSVKGIKTAQRSSKAAQQAAKTAQKTAQATAKSVKASAQAAKAAAKATVTGVKAAIHATVTAVKTTIAAVKGLIAAIAAGGWVAVVIILLICLIALVVGSCFGIFFSGEDSGNDMTMPSVVQEISLDYQNRLNETLRCAGDFRFPRRMAGGACRLFRENRHRSDRRAGGSHHGRG